MLNSRSYIIPVAGITLFILALGALTIGRYNIPIGRVLEILLSKITGSTGDWSKIDETVLFKVRLPRIILSLVIGAGLSVSGVSMQALFSNPLVSSHILGVSYGAGLGAAIGILLGFNNSLIQLLAVITGVCAITLTLLISNSKRGRLNHMLVLSGVVVGAVFQSLISLIKYVADPEEKLPTIVYWLLGSLAGTSQRDLIYGLPLIIVGIVMIFIVRWRLNILSLSHNEAVSLGINIKKMRMIVIAATTMVSAVSVSLCGIIGFVGLVVPHLTRMLVGPDYKKQVPGAILIGGIYLLIIDTLSRSLTEAEIPLSILTSVIGAPFFAFLLKKTGGLWSD